MPLASLRWKRTHVMRGWLAVTLVLTAALFFYNRSTAPFPHVNLRWAAGVDASERIALEQTFHLGNGEFREERTWTYRIEDLSPANVARILADPRVEDTYGIERGSLTVAGAPRVSELLTRAMVLGVGIPAVLLVSGVLLARLTWAVVAVWTTLANSETRWVSRMAHGHWMVAPAIIWLAIAIPYVAVGPDDLEEYFTGVVSTKLAVDAVIDGAWPLWNVDLGLGNPLPLRFHFITHPIAPLCAAFDCHAVLRGIVSMHLLLGCAVMGLLAIRFTGNRALACAAAISYGLSSSVIQPLLIDDWPITSLNESMLPVLLYALFALGDASDRRQALMWTLVLGGVAGLALSMSFPVLMLLILALVALSAPFTRRRLPWLVLAACITALIGGAQVHHIFDEYAQTSAGVMRTNHGDIAGRFHLWSVFLRPLFSAALSPDDNPWRTAFFGPPLALAGVAAFVRFRDQAIRPLQAGLAIGILGFVIPPAWLFDINTAQWLYRTELNVFGILLGVYGIHRYLARRGSPRWSRFAVAIQLAWVVVAFVPPWYPVFASSTGIYPPGRFTLSSPGIAEDIRSLYRQRPGRVAFAPAAHFWLRKPQFTREGLAPNQLATLGVPTASAVVFGTTTDALSPMSATIEGEIQLAQATVLSREALDVLGIRYVAAYGDEPVAVGLVELRRYPKELRLFENPSAWPEASFVDQVPATPIPRLATCPHNRFLCADFSKLGVSRTADSTLIERLHDGLRIQFAPSDAPRTLLISQWFRPGWTVTEGNATVMPGAEQLLAVDVAAGERSIAVRFRPRLRQVLFLSGFVGLWLCAFTVLVMSLRLRTASLAYGSTTVVRALESVK